MTIQILWITGAAIIALMGLLHIRGTLGSDRVGPRDSQLKTDMKSMPLLLTDKLNMWDSWVGFNATHGSGAAFFGLVNVYLALKHQELLLADTFLLTLSLAGAGFYVWVAGKYWFRTVFILLLVAGCCLLTAYILLFFGT